MSEDGLLETTLTLSFSFDFFDGLVDVVDEHVQDEEENEMPLTRGIILLIRCSLPIALITKRNELLL